MSTRFSDFKFSRRHSYLTARRWKLRFGAALYHWSSLKFNPFLSREWRRSTRGKSGPFFILWPLIFIGIALVLTAQFYETASHVLTALLANQPIQPIQVARILGDNPIYLMALVAAGFCGYATLIYSQRAARIFQRENLSGTLNQLLLLPLSETRIALLTSAPATASTMALWFFLLPLWMLALATDQWSWREFFGVPLLFLLFLIRPPEWTPLYETYTPHSATFDDSKGEQKTKEETEKEPPKSDAPVTQKQESANEFEDEDEPEFSDYLPDPTYQRLFKFDPVGIITLLIAWQLAMFWARFAGFRTPPSALHYLLPHWREFLPQNLWNLLPSILLSWPLLIVHLLTTPLPFFTVALPLGLWLIPRFILLRVAGFSIFRLSFLGSRSLQFRRWGRHWRAAKKGQAYLFWFFASGFLWPWLISKGAFAAVLPGAPINALWARAGLWTVLLIIATWAMSARLHSVLDTPFKNSHNPRFQRATLARWRRAWRNARSIIFWSVALYLVLCWLGGTSGMEAVWRSRLLTTFLVMAAYLLADFSAIALKNALPEHYRNFWGWIRFFWFWGLFWEAVFRVSWAHYAALPFDLSDTPHVLFSPLVSLLTLLNNDVALPLQGALWQLSFALIIFAAAYQLTFQSHGAVAPQAISIPTEETAEGPSLFLKFLTTLWRIIWFVPGLILRIIFLPIKMLAIGSYRFLERAKNAALPFLDRQVQELWRWIDSFDNPILRHDLRSKRDENLSVFWLSIVAFQCLVFLILLGLALLKPVSLLFYGGNTESNRQAALELLHWSSWGDVVFGVTMAFGLLPNLAALFSQVKVFDKGRANGGMVFLFLTPLSEREIIGGHIGAAIVSGAWFHSALYPSILLSFLLEIVAGRSAILPVLLLLTILLHALLLLSATTSVWSAVRAKNAGEGGLWALFFGLVPQAIFVFVLLMIVTTTQGFWASFATAFGIGLCLFAAYLFWLDALRCLRRERFRDVSLRGTVAN